MSPNKNSRRAPRYSPPVGGRGIPVVIGDFEVSNDSPLFFIAGLCVLESTDLLSRVGRALKSIFARVAVPWVLKCSFDKANRTSLKSYRGQGLQRSLEAFARIKRELGVPMITDVHEAAQAAEVAKVVDMIQVPAFLSRQTDLLVACGRTGKPVNIKKGQFLAPWDVKNAIGKVESTGNRRILVTERGTTFGYGNLVVDMRGLELMKDFGYPVVMDATHAVQLPGGLGAATGGERRFAPTLMRAAAAVGVAGVSLETHPEPERALSDGPNSLRLSEVEDVVRLVCEIDALIKRSGGRVAAPAVKRTRS
ncbi:MAG: 3-deoxy-8-phosphooctulonate synthase [Elusimicrobia bacterium]|nr:3-deoxy-8-phosphooctulonate synthase [Elusimicrobiota bacterium]